MSDELETQVQPEAPAVETTEVHAKEFDNNTTRDAIKKAIDVHGGRTVNEAPTKTEISQAIDNGIQPPASFNKEEMEAWRRGDLAGVQKAFLRVDNSRNAEIQRAKAAERKAREEVEREKAGLKHVKDMSDRVKTYLASRGDAVPDEQKIAEALYLVEQLKGPDKRAIKAELKKAGIDLDAEGPSQAPVSMPKEWQDELKSLQEFKNEYTREKEQQQFRNLETEIDSIFARMRAEKTRTGDAMFPGLDDDTQAGLEFATALGSYAYDPGYQALVRRRFPDATQETFIREAYKDLGGKVSGEPAKASTQTNQQHLERSRRAAAATPGRVAPRVSDANLSGKLGLRAAIEASVQRNRDR